MLAKLAAPRFLADIRPLLSADQAALLGDESINAAFMDVFETLIGQLAGAPWARTAEMKERFGLL